MPAMKFTARSVHAIKPPFTGRVEYFDRNLVLRVSSSGHRAWYVLYRVNNRLRRMQLGEYRGLTEACGGLTLAEARAKANEALHAAANDKDLGAEKRAKREAGTFGALVEDFLSSRLKNGKPKRSNPEFRRLLENYFGDWFSRKVFDISKQDVRERILRERKRGEAHARKCFAVLRALFNFGIDNYDELQINPMPKPKSLALEPPGERERVLTPEEIRSIWKSVSFEESRLQIYLKLRFYTAQRGGEVLTVEWPEIDFDNATWSMPGDKAKNGQANRIPLSRQALSLFRELSEIKDSVSSKAEKKGLVPLVGSSWAFPTRTKYCADKPIENVQKFFQRVRVRAGVILALGPKATDEEIAQAMKAPCLEQPDYTLHDIRRTCSTGMASIGVPQHVIDRIMNHIDRRVSHIYNRYGYDREKRDALQAWADFLDEVLKYSQMHKVLEMDCRKAPRESSISLTSAAK